MNGPVRDLRERTLDAKKPGRRRRKLAGPPEAIQS